MISNAFLPKGIEEVKQNFLLIAADSKVVNIISTEIFDRWGEKVYFSSGNEFWNGTYEYRKITQEVFLYKVLFDTPCGTKTITGQMMLLK